MSTLLPAHKESKINLPLSSPAIYYRAEGFNTSHSKLMGRQAAGESFLKALSQDPNRHSLSCYAPTVTDAQDFEQKVQTFSVSPKKTHWLQPGDFEGLEESGCLFIPSPGLGEFAWQRRHYRQDAYSLCGITHTTASNTVMSSLGHLLTAPTQPWDALICTSHSVKHMVQTVLGNYQEYLGERFQTRSVSIPIQLPVIPLGIDAHQFRPTTHKRQMGQFLRAKFDISPDTVVILFTGRLSFHAKANPYPMFLALEQAAQRTGKNLCLILAGWYANDYIQQSFQQAARILCPSVRLLELDGRKAIIRECIWYAADLFTSLSDNIQETFGLTPLEAKAAGLPVVVSDWDGYQETVRQGKDGFLIPTTMPMPGCGVPLALRYALEVDDYDQYIGQVSQTIAVSIEAATQAYIKLIEHPELRTQMGQAGQADVSRRFDWPVILNTYQQLWSQLADIRGRAQELAPRKPMAPANPLRDDPYQLFQAYPRIRLGPQSQIAVDNLIRLNQIKDLQIIHVGHPMRLNPEQIQALLQVLMSTSSISLGELLQQFPPCPPSIFYRTVGWLLKIGVIQLV